MKRVYNNEFNNTDLDVYECGTEQCKSNHFFGPGVKGFYKIHYIHNGKGIFQMENKTYELSKGQGFVIPPNTLVHYKADAIEPWKYSWIGFCGLKADSMLKQSGIFIGSPVFDCPSGTFIDKCLQEMLKGEEISFGRDAYLRGYLYLILSAHMEKCGRVLNLGTLKDRKEVYVRKAIEFIERNYDKKITIENISNYIGIDSKYLWKLFHTLLGISPVKYLLNKRVEKASELMKNPMLSISDISRSVGYEDPLQFSKMFKRIKGVSPNSYRKQ